MKDNINIVKKTSVPLWRRFLALLWDLSQPILFIILGILFNNVTYEFFNNNVLTVMFPIFIVFVAIDQIILPNKTGYTISRFLLGFRLIDSVSGKFLTKKMLFLRYISFSTLRFKVRVESDEIIKSNCFKLFGFVSVVVMSLLFLFDISITTYTRRMIGGLEENHRMEVKEIVVYNGKKRDEIEQLVLKGMDCSFMHTFTYKEGFDLKFESPIDYIIDMNLFDVYNYNYCEKKHERQEEYSVFYPYRSLLNSIKRTTYIMTNVRYGDSTAIEIIQCAKDEIKRNVILNVNEKKYKISFTLNREGMSDSTYVCVENNK